LPLKRARQQDSQDSQDSADAIVRRFDDFGDVFGKFMTLLILLLGLTVGVMVGLLGIGGGVVLVPAMVYLLHFDQHMAQGTSLLILLPPIGLGALRQYWKSGNVDLRAGVYCAIGFLLGGHLGGRVAVPMRSASLQATDAIGGATVAKDEAVFDPTQSQRQNSHGQSFEVAGDYRCGCVLRGRCGDGGNWRRSSAGAVAGIAIRIQPASRAGHQPRRAYSSYRVARFSCVRQGRVCFVEHRIAADPRRICGGILGRRIGAAAEACFNEAGICGFDVFAGPMAGLLRVAHLTHTSSACTTSTVTSCRGSTTDQKR
jgi:hypothetical protein